MRRAYYSSSITDFLGANPDAIIGELTRAHARNLEQIDAWLDQINSLKRVLTNRSGRIYFEYANPRMGKSIDVVLLIGSVIFVLEFKVGKSHFAFSALDAGKPDTSRMTDTIDEIIRASRDGDCKSIRFVTDVTGPAKLGRRQLHRKIERQPNGEVIRISDQKHRKYPRSF